MAMLDRCLPSGLRVDVHCPFDEEHLRWIRYLCSCGHALPLCRLFFCRYCFELRCGNCVSHEVDSLYCPNCLENMPSAEARLKKNRCANCFDCPSCGNTLSTRATPSGSVPDRGIPGKKVYYLVCFFCRWTTRDVGLPDQPTSRGGWIEPENPDAARFTSLLEHYRVLAHKEKTERESRRFLGMKLSYAQLADKHRLGTAFARRKVGFPSPFMTSDTEATTSPSVAVSIDSVEKFDADSPGLSLREVPDLCLQTRLECRLMQADRQPASVLEAFPRQKHLVVKRSQRCRKCEHSLIKPEYNTSSIKFQLRLTAIDHVPEVILQQLSSTETLIPGRESTFVIKVSNPTQLHTHFRLRVLSKSEGTGDPCNDATENLDDNNIAFRQPTLVRAMGSHVVSTNAVLVADSSYKIDLPPRDDAAEFDDLGPDVVSDEDKKCCVVWRKANKVGVLVRAVVDEGVEPGEEVVIGLGLEFLYINTVPTLEQKELQSSEIFIPIYIRLGKIPLNSSA